MPDTEQDERQERNETWWIAGDRAAWRTMLGECLRHLGYDSEECREVAWITEREDAVAKLREVCEWHGDNDWEDNLHLADVIEKHLYNHLEADCDEEE